MVCHSGQASRQAGAIRNPEVCTTSTYWIPAYAGMTKCRIALTFTEASNHHESAAARYAHRDRLSCPVLRSDYAVPRPRAALGMHLGACAGHREVLFAGRNAIAARGCRWCALVPDQGDGRPQDEPREFLRLLNCPQHGAWSSRRNHRRAGRCDQPRRLPRFAALHAPGARGSAVGGTRC